MNSPYSSRSFQSPRTPTFSSNVKSFTGKKSSLLSSHRLGGRGSLTGKSNQSIQIVYKSSSHIVEKFGSFLPVTVKEATKYADRNSQSPSCHISDSGWAWFVLGRRLLVWHAKGKDNQCRELELPASDLSHRASLVCVFTALGGQACIAVSPEGNIRYWPTINHAEMSFDDNTDLQGQECDSLHHIHPIGFVLVTTTASLVIIQPQITCGRTLINVRKLKQSSGWLGGFGQKFSILLGAAQTQTQETKLVKMITKRHGSLANREWQVIVIAGHSIQKWILSAEESERLLYDADLSTYLQDNYLKILSWDYRYADVLLIDAHIIGNDIILLLATKNSSLSPLSNFAFMTINTDSATEVKFLGINFIKNVDWQVITSDFNHQRDVKPVRLLINQSTPIVYNRRFIVPILGESEEEVDMIDLSNNVEFHILDGAILNSSLPVFFSRHHGFMSLLPSDVHPDDVLNCSTNLGAMTNELLSFCESDIDKLSKENDNNSKMKSAFLQFVSNNFVSSEQLLKESFPEDLSVPYLTDAPLDMAVLQVARGLIDDIPAKDPRWSEFKNLSATFGVSTTISLDISTQLEEKKQVIEWYFAFLKEMGVWNRLSYSTHNKVCMATTFALADYAEKNVAAITLRKLQKEFPSVVEKSIEDVITERRVKLSTDLTNPDLFYREVSKMHQVVQHMVSQSDVVVHSSKSPQMKAAHLANVNSVLLEVFRAVTSYRRNKEDFFLPAPNILTKSSEYLPWTTASGKDGLYDDLIHFQKLTLKYGVRADIDDPELSNQLYDQLLALDEFILDGFKTYVQSLQKSPKYETIKSHFERDRFNLIAPLLDDKCADSGGASYLAEKYQDFEILMRCCDATENTHKLSLLMDKFVEEEFARFVYTWYVQNSKPAKLLEYLCESDDLCQDAYKPTLMSFFEDHPRLAWIYAVNTRDYNLSGDILFQLANQETKLMKKKKQMLNLSKLSYLTCAGSEQIDHVIKQINQDLLIIEHQENLPEDVLNIFGYSLDTVKVFSVPEIIRMNICEENASANEFTFRTALDLLEFVEDDVERSSLLLEVWIKSILRDEEKYVTPFEDNQDPVDFIQNLLFFKIIDVIVQFDASLDLYLLPLNKLLECEDLPEELRNNNQFKYILRIGYEHVSKTLQHQLS